MSLITPFLPNAQLLVSKKKKNATIQEGSIFLHHQKQIILEFLFKERRHETGLPSVNRAILLQLF